MSANSRQATRIVEVGLYLVLSGRALAGQEPSVWSVSPSPEIEIGVADGDERYMFQTIAGARFMPGGRIAVADRGFLNVRIYDSKGMFELRIGGPGQGPGELMDISGLWSLPDGRIAVWDPANRRITTFAGDGALDGTGRARPDAGAAGNLEVFFGSFANGDALLASIHFGPPRRGEVIPDPWVLGRYGLDGDFKAHLGHVRGMRRYDRNPIPFTPMPAVALRGDSLLVADGYEGRISVRDRSGTAVRSIEVPPAPDVSPRAAWSSLEAEVRDRGDALGIEILDEERVPRADRIPRIGGFLVDDRGRMWVKEFDVPADALWLRDDAMRPAPGGRWWVLGPDGTQVATVRMTERVRPFQVEGDRLLGVAFDAFDVPRIVVYRIERRGRRLASTPLRLRRSGSF